MGWVSILQNGALRKILGIPSAVMPVAYLCIGYPERFLQQPELEEVGWAARLPLERLIYLDRWGRKTLP